jgi:hypothetical protein
VAGGASANDLCEDSISLSGPTEEEFDLTLASTDGPAHTACSGLSEDQIDNDVWYCWTADCDVVAVAHTCDLSDVDTRIAVYEGCDCPPTDERLLTCSDDECGVQSRATFAVTSGQSYLIRVGMFPPTDAGTGSVRITCGFAACPGGGSCNEGGEGPGCSDIDCCNRVCSVDSLCCDDVWDEYCADEAAGLCSDGFASCGSAANDCTETGEGAGCAHAECCNRVCEVDPYCCIEEWDATCVELEAANCSSTCVASAGDCLESHASPGCNDSECCAEVCPRDTFCCTTEWDEGCASSALELCQ